MPKSFTLIVALATLAVFSVVTWAKSITPTAMPKDAQCRQSACTTKCDAKGEKCLVTCDDKQTSNNCSKSFYRVSPFGVLEVTPPASPIRQRTDEGGRMSVSGQKQTIPERAKNLPAPLSKKKPGVE